MMKSTINKDPKATAIKLERIKNDIDATMGVAWDLYEDSDAVMAILVGSIHEKLREVLSDAVELEAAWEGRCESTT